MRTLLLLISFSYMLLVAVLLASGAMWICDGYYPVGWGWKGTAIHFAMWAMPVSLVAGSFASALGIGGIASRVLLVAGVAPFVVWVFLLKAPQQDSWLRLRFIAAVLTLAATWMLVRRNAQRNELELSSHTQT